MGKTRVCVECCKECTLRSDAEFIEKGVETGGADGVEGFPGRGWDAGAGGGGAGFIEEIGI